MSLLTPITPDGQINLLSLPILLDYKNQLSFETQQDQFNYFITKRQINLSADNATYMKKDGVIKVPFHCDTLWGINYIMYQNTNFSNKWFYAFVVDKEYINDNCTALKIQTDVFQTWQFDIQILDSFVEREMIDVENDFPRC